jgi:Tol biopolymer transport system component
MSFYRLLQQLRMAGRRIGARGVLRINAGRLACLCVSLLVLGSAAGAGGAAALPDGRHFERVSPAEKGDGDLIAEGFKAMASELGDGAAFESRMVFGDAVGSGTVGRTTYVARRGGGGVWSTRSVTPMPRPDTVQVLFASNRVEMMAEDLSNAFVWAYDLPAVTDDPPDLENLYALDTATGGLRTISKSLQDHPFALFDFLNTSFFGYSDDAKHIAFRPASGTPMLPDAPPGALYKWDDGVLSVVGLLPDGEFPPAGATVFPENIKGTMSADGSRLAFMASPDGSAPSQLYLHVDGEDSVWVSEPETSNNDKTPPGGITFEGMTPDGKHVFFSTDVALVDEDTAGGPDLYRFTYSPDADSAGDNLTLITNNGGALNDAGFGGALVGMSDDAKRVYVHSSGATLDLWQEGSPGLTTVDPSAPRPTAPKDFLTLVASIPGMGRVSPDGNWFAYLKYVSGSGDYRMFLYDRAADSLVCVSCPSDASVEPTITNSGLDKFKSFRPRFLSDDGQVFFSTTGGLVAADTNGVADVYEYDGQTKTLSLLTSGKRSEPSMFADASRSGDDVFVFSRQQLVPSDTDDYVDLYDVRVGPAPASQPVDTAPACEGEGCQGTLSGAPAEGVLGSLSFDNDPEGARRGVRLAVRRRAVFRGVAGSLVVRTGRGRIAWRGRGLASGSLRRGRAGKARLRLRLNRRARIRLRRSGRYTTVVRLTFRAGDGASASRRVRVTFRAATRNGGR